MLPSSLVFLFFDLTDGGFRSKTPHSLALMKALFSLSYLPAPQGTMATHSKGSFPPAFTSSCLPPHHPFMASCLQRPKPRSMPPFTFSSNDHYWEETSHSNDIGVANNEQSPVTVGPLLLVTNYLPCPHVDPTHSPQWLFQLPHHHHHSSWSLPLTPAPTHITFSRWPHHPPSLWKKKKPMGRKASPHPPES